MNEHSFIQSVHRKLARDLYVWKINAAFQNGVPDAYYSGAAGDLWIEYKYGTSHEVSALQHLWLTERNKEGRECWLVWGRSPNEVSLFKGPDYPRRYDKSAKVVPKHELISEILTHCIGTGS